MILQACVLGVDVDFRISSVASPGMRGIKLRLRCCSVTRLCIFEVLGLTASAIMAVCSNTGAKGKTGKRATHDAFRARRVPTCSYTYRTAGTLPGSRRAQCPLSRAIP